MKRKTFLRNAGAMAMGAFVLHHDAGVVTRTGSRGPWPPFSPDDERFWAFLRDQFPLSRDRAYLNTGGLGASPYVVIETVKGTMDELERSSETGRTEELWTQVKGSAARLLGCDPEELAFTRNTTEGINIVAHGLPLRKGDEIITTTHEHVGNAFTWIVLQKRLGVVLKLFEPSTLSMQENIDRIQKLIGKRTRLISIPHAVTTTGLLLPVKEIAALARRHNLWFFIDGAQTAGMLPLNLHEIGCDAYATSGHKWLMGPKETGLLYVRKEMLDTVEARFTGAYSEAGFDFQKGTFALHPTAQRYEYGTVSAPLRAGLGAAIDFIHRIGIENVWKRDQSLSTRLDRGLREIVDITVLSPEKDDMRSAMITFMHGKRPYLELQDHLTTYNLRTRAVSEGGLAALRISTHIYNSMEEVERVLEAVRAVG